MSPTRTTFQTSDYSTENERPLSAGANKRQRPDTLKASGFAPLRVIAERDGEHSTASMQILDIENGDEEPKTVIRPEPMSRTSRFGAATKETGV